MFRAEDGVERPHGIFAFGDGLHEVQQCALGVLPKRLCHPFAAHAERLKRFLGVFRQRVRRAQTNEHGVGSRRRFLGPHLGIEERSPQSRNLLSCKAVNLGCPAGSVGKIDNLGGFGIHAVGKRIHGIAQQAYTILTELEVVAQAGHSIPGFFCADVKGDAHLGGVLGKNEQFFLFDACRTCRCGNFSQPLGRHRQPGGHFQQVLAEHLEARIVKIRDLFHVSHAGFIINGQLDGHGYGGGLRRSTHQPPIQIIPLGTQGVPPLTVRLHGLLDTLCPCRVFRQPAVLP